MYHRVARRRTSALRITLVFILTLVFPSLLLSGFAYQAVEAERRARLAERSSRIQSDARDLARELDHVYTYPVKLLRGEVEGSASVAKTARPMSRLVALQPLFKGFFVLDASGERVYPRGPANVSPNLWPDPCAGIVGGLLGVTRPSDPERLLKLAEAAGTERPSRAHAFLEAASRRGPTASRLTALFELAGFHQSRMDISPASGVIARETYAALAAFPVELLDTRGREAPALARFWLASIERATDDPAYVTRARMLLEELEAAANAMPADALARMCESGGGLLSEDDPGALSRARAVAFARRQLESHYARLEDRFGQVLREALRRGESLPSMRGGSIEGSSRDATGVSFVKARAGDRYEILTYTLLRDPEGEALGLVAVQIDPEAARSAFQSLLDRVPGARLVAREEEPTNGRFQVPLGAPFDHLAAEFSSLPQGAEVVDSALGMPRETVQLWAIFLSIAGIAAGIVVTIRTVRREAKAAQLKSDFVANVTHELKTPLTSIQMFLDTLILGRVEDEAEAQECLQIMSRESQRLSRLIEQLLVFSRIENKKWRVRFTFAEAPRLVDEAIAVLADHLQKTPEELAVEVATVQETPKIPVDRFAIKEALLNLLHNAIKYSPNPDRKVRVVITSRRRFVEIAVEDNGMGVPARDRRRIFVKFERGSNAEKGRIEGSGIGLTLANSIVKAHGGKVTYTALKPRGSRFSVFLPK